MTDLHDLPEPITSSRVRIPPSERAKRLKSLVLTALSPDEVILATYVLDLLSHANRDAVRELLNARREGLL